VVEAGAMFCLLNNLDSTKRAKRIFQSLLMFRLKEKAHTVRFRTAFCAPSHFTRSVVLEQMLMFGRLTSAVE
jgi:hypothetical protein